MTQSYHETVSVLRSVEATRNGIGARLSIDAMSDPMIVVQSHGDELAVVPDTGRDTGRAYRLTIDVWNDYYQDSVCMVRDWFTDESRGLVKEAERLPGYEVTSLERDYGVHPMETSGMWAPPQFYRRPPMREPRRVSAVG